MLTCLPVTICIRDASMLVFSHRQIVVSSYLDQFYSAPLHAWDTFFNLYLGRKFILCIFHCMNGGISIALNEYPTIH